jgi:hypothetical protein
MLLMVRHDLTNIEANRRSKARTFIRQGHGAAGQTLDQCTRIAQGLQAAIKKVGQIAHLTAAEAKNLGPFRHWILNPKLGHFD